MPLVTEVTSGMVDGLPATLETVLPSESDGTLDLSFYVTRDGLASAANPEVNIALVLDVSGSVGADSGSDLDGDGINETYLEAEIMGAQSLFAAMQSAGFEGDETRFSLITYNGSATTLGTFTLDDQAGFDAALTGLTASGQTNFSQAMNEVVGAWDALNADASPDNDVLPTASNHVIFMSDGVVNGGGTDFSAQIATLEGTYNASVSAIGIGTGSDMVALELLDNSGGAEQVTDITQLNQAIAQPPPPLQQLTHVEVLIGGVPQATYTPGDGTLQSAPVGYFLPSDILSGFAFTAGQNLNIEIVAHFDSGESLSTQHSAYVPNWVCFAAGTMIQTPDGPRAIETLAEGDLLNTLDSGPMPIRWIGSKHISPEMLAMASNLRPVRIAAGTMRRNVPNQALYLSRQHKVYVKNWKTKLHYQQSDGVLIPAKALVNDAAIRWAEDVSHVTYYHILLDRHEILFANGLCAESLNPAAITGAGLPGETSDELLTLFPDLARAAGRTARQVLTVQEGRKIAEAGLSPEPPPDPEPPASAGPHGGRTSTP